MFNAGLQCGQQGTRLFRHGAGLLDLQTGYQSCLLAPLRDLQRLVLRRQVVTRKRQACLRAAQQDVIQCDLGRDLYLHIAQAGDTGLRSIFAGTQASTISAKYIDNPVAIDTDCIVSTGAMTTRRALLYGGRTGERRPQSRRRDIAQCTRLKQRRLRFVDAAIGLHCVGYKLAEQRIIEALPPVCQRGFTGYHWLSGSGSDGRIDACPCCRYGYR